MFTAFTDTRLGRMRLCNSFVVAGMAAASLTIAQELVRLAAVVESGLGSY